MLYKESVFQYKKYTVLHVSEAERKMLGEHFIVGFRNPAEGKKLVEQAKVGGVYLTKRNVKDVSVDELLNSDLTTFFEISQAQPTAIMVSHALLDDVDT